MTIRPIRTKTDYKSALKRIEALMTARRSTQQGDELDVLATLVEAYEAKHFIIEAPEPVEAILHRMEALELTRKDLEPFIGSRARVSEVLSKKRPLTLPMIRKLHKYLSIPAEILIAA
jgi:HTH-type transcriptional regulator / antitoxin HigA